MALSRCKESYNYIVSKNKNKNTHKKKHTKKNTKQKTNKQTNKLRHLIQLCHFWIWHQCVYAKLVSTTVSHAEISNKHFGREVLGVSFRGYCTTNLKLAFFVSSNISNDNWENNILSKIILSNMNTANYILSYVTFGQILCVQKN